MRTLISSMSQNLRKYDNVKLQSVVTSRPLPKATNKLPILRSGEHALKVAIVSPWPTAAGEDPPSGVANYLTDVLLSGSIPCEVHLIAQRGCRENLATDQVTVHPSWRPGLRAPIDVFRALRSLRPDIIHLHHEFRLFGSVFATGAVVAAVVMGSSSARLITTIHGVVPKARLDGQLMGIDNYPAVTSLARYLLALNYRILGAISDQVVVLHEALQEVLENQYSVHSIVIPLGIPDKAVKPQNIALKREPNTVMIFGFLAAYKRPELILDMAEQNILPGTRYIVSVALNPRIRDKAYQQRYNVLRERAKAVRDQVTWYDYLPDDELDILLSRVSTLVLPYTDLVAASAVGTQGLGCGITVCHSVALKPIFGAGPNMFELTTSSLRSAILAANLDGKSHRPPAPPWKFVLQQTADLWNEMITR